MIDALMVFKQSNLTANIRQKRQKDPRMFALFSKPFLNRANHAPIYFHYPARLFTFVESMNSIRMKLVSLSFSIFILSNLPSLAQNAGQQLQKAFQQFESDAQLQHAIASLYVVDAKTGQVVFAKNEQLGLAPASTQKIITGATALELLGKEFRFKTEFAYRGELKERDSLLVGDLYISGNGDPTFGSQRYFRTKPSEIERGLLDKLRSIRITHQRGEIVILRDGLERQAIPDGWIWQDIGNYYGAGPGSINWNENQFDIVFKPGIAQGEPTQVIRTRPDAGLQFINEVTSGASNSGDHAYAYFEPGKRELYLKGTIPCCVDTFTISGAIPSGEEFALTNIASILGRNGWQVSAQSVHSTTEAKYKSKPRPFYTHYSPSLDSIVYWLNRKSINLYAESLLKILGSEKRGFGSTENGVSVIRDFWKAMGIEETELNLHDGSGLSPQNRVTTHAQVEILKFARSRVWYSYFYESLPEYNGMKMKSGTIGDAKAFCGYHKSKDGKEYIFSFIVNNYNGVSSLLVNKMYHVLDLLK